MTTKSYIRVLLVATALALVHAASPPNILFIISDDLGYGEVGLYSVGSPHGRIPTPNIDALFLSGVRFTHAYAGAPVCAPSRNALLTGQHTGHTWVRGNVAYEGHDLPLRKEDITLPMVLGANGYRTALVGKWGLGYENSTGAAWSKGWDTYFGQLDQSYCHNMYPSFPLGVWNTTDAGGTVNHIEYAANVNASRARCMAADTNPPCVWTHDLWTNKALELLDEQAAAGPDAKPLFMMLSYTDPHAGGWTDNAAETGAPVPDDGIFANRTGWPIVERDHASVISTFQDRDVGRIIAALEANGLRENTLVMFASDNGAHNEGGHSYHFFNSSGPLRGFKRSLYEGGMRSAIAVSWPGVIPANLTSDAPWAFWDVLPTVAAVSGVPSGSLPTGMDGISVEDLWMGKAPAAQHPPFYWEFCTVHSNNADGPSPDELEAMRAGTGAPATWGHALRSGDLKIVNFAVGTPLQLYNLTADPAETTDIAAAHPDIVAAMEAIAKASHIDNPNFPVTNCIGS